MSAPFAIAADFVTTRATGTVKKGYPLKVPAGSFVEVVQVGGFNASVPYPTVKFADGRVADNVIVNQRIFHGFKFAGVSRIEFSGLWDHVILWKITPASEFGKDGASYVTVIPGLPPQNPGSGYEVPPNRLLRVLQTVDSGATGTEPNWASVRMDSSVSGLSSGGYLPTPSEAFPFLTDYYCDYLTTIEVLPAASAAAVTLTVEQSDDLSQWIPLRTFQVEAAEAQQFFRTTIDR
ncbi:hypothetical protein [Haloferula helveola]|uniref:hypothetical protein n=1 Tax=Haloferula helveola TaxID=490095 RepID=UPI0030D4719F